MNRDELHTDIFQLADARSQVGNAHHIDHDAPVPFLRGLDAVSNGAVIGDRQDRHKVCAGIESELSLQFRPVHYLRVAEQLHLGKEPLDVADYGNPLSNEEGSADFNDIDVCLDSLDEIQRLSILDIVQCELKPCGHCVFLPKMLRKMSRRRDAARRTIRFQL